MPMISPAGRARISLRRPQAIGECSRCGMWVNQADMVRQFQWAGNTLADTGLMVCNSRGCLDTPQEQFRTLIFPADPKPIINARVSFNTTPIPVAIGQPLPTSPENLGFTQYTLDNNEGTGNWPTTQASALAAVLAAAGVTAPGGLAAYIQTMTQSVPVVLRPANATRVFFLVYNPTSAPAQIALATSITPGSPTNLAIGPGQAYFWANSQGLGSVWQGAVSAITLNGDKLPLWIWEA